MAKPALQEPASFNHICSLSFKELTEFTKFTKLKKFTKFAKENQAKSYTTLKVTQRTQTFTYIGIKILQLNPLRQLNYTKKGTKKKDEPLINTIRQDQLAQKSTK